MMRAISALVLCLFASLVHADQKAVREYVRTHEPQIVREFEAFLRIPNVATDTVNIRRNADALLAMMKVRNLSPRLLALDDDSVPPAVYGERRVPGAQRTLIFYAHYDGQAVDPSQWASNPWVPTWRDGPQDSGAKIVELPAKAPYDPDWRLYARSASDDKAGVMSILNAVAALDEAGLSPRVNLKFFFEGEEEQGSPHMRAILTKYRDLLTADAWIICDGPAHSNGHAQVVFGVRGDLNVHLTVFGPKRPLHSGHYGNWAPNPAWRLASLLASMKDEQGRVLIHGWYDDVVPLSKADREALAAAPQEDPRLRTQLGLASTDMPDRTLLEAITLPSLNVNGIRAADVEAQARNVIPTRATATLDLRLVKGNVPQRQVDRLTAHIRKQGYLVLDREPTDEERLEHGRIAMVKVEPGGYPASRTAMDTPLAQAVVKAAQSASPEPIVVLPTAGGSLPLSLINEVLGADSITLAVVNHDNNQHAENENLRLGRLWVGIEMVAALMRMEVVE